ncbi:MAG: hypothetical protein K2Q17_02415 [Nitrospiraceae bacterium]|uniref:hypothetical protein n=1 Tax=Nitrospira cf. moscoviensis SBR1015 TaxID=96242 RepID=UPI00111CCABB|nr:hypothetical protein [Nitrospira cf. moscoviensis SBR1015]MBY0246495.1 hypothetical protein [Nitrospiraceae bacterium]
MQRTLKGQWYNPDRSHDRLQGRTPVEVWTEIDIVAARTGKTGKPCVTAVDTDTLPYGVYAQSVTGGDSQTRNDRTAEEIVSRR